MKSTKKSSDWLNSAKQLLETFSREHALVLESSERQVSAAFEVACLHSLLRFYESQRYTLKFENLKGGAYRYLTTPSGNPDNFSYVTVAGPDGKFAVRQQVRIESYISGDICFTPDLLVLVNNAKIEASTSNDFAGGKRKFFSVKSTEVVAAHECKSMNPFPELMVGFIGMLITAHSWYSSAQKIKFGGKGHLAPTLFVGGTSRALHLKMIAAMETAYPINILVGMHAGTWNLRKARNRFRWDVS